MRRVDIAVIGSGFSGSLMAMIARRLGYSVMLLEKGRHPRMAIGESSTPLANLLFESLADRYDLPAIRPLAKYGTWQRAYPEIACGLKRGFTFYHHALGEAGDAGGEESRLLVAASPHDAIADTHWFRRDFDWKLVQEAQKQGAEYFDEVRLSRVEQRAGGLAFELECPGCAPEHVEARLVVDASGPRGFLHSALRLTESPLPGYPETSALYSHFSGVSLPEDRDALAPYPPENAAVHHVFDGGWIWVLRFNNGITSAGVAATAQASARLGLERGEAGWQDLLSQLPGVRAQFKAARAETGFTFLRRMAFLDAQVAGSNWAMLPSAAGFVDPLLSTGFPLALLGVTRLATILKGGLDHDLAAPLASYALNTRDEIAATSRLIASLYANMRNFPVFRSLTLLYFAAAAYSETVRRLNKPERARSFLLHDEPGFGSRSAELIRRAHSIQSPEESERFREDVLAAIARWDVAGFSDRSRLSRYPVLADDLLSSAAKVGSTRQELETMLDRSGFYAPRCEQVRV